jgi:[acyl-carrier-protein] S-malonyltransferase
VQVVGFLASQMYLAALSAERIAGTCSLGLSLGEYSHLVHIGAIGFDEALRLVEERGRCFDQAPPGMMATVLALDHAPVAAVIERARMHGEIVISNYNAPTQHVISGSTAAVEWAARTLEAEHLAHVEVIERRVPMHSPLMSDVGRRFAGALARTWWSMPSREYWPNVAGTPLPTPSADDLVSCLTRHVSEPVRWQTSVDAIVHAFPNATFVEIGPGGVLTNMLRRAWRGVRCARIDANDEVDPRGYFTLTVESLRA